jgi:hypothetical protein
MMTKNCSRKDKCVNLNGPELAFSEFGKHKETKDGLQSWCKACNVDATKKNYKVNRKARLRQQKQYTEANKDIRSIYAKQYRIDNKKSISAYGKEHYKNNPEMYTAKTAKRRAAIIQRMVLWADPKKIEKMYWVAKTLTDRTGIQWVVDHKIPLQGRNVSGLHIEGNLQVITHSRNARKSNKFES